MGRYAHICGEEVKFQGLLAKVCKSLGIKENIYAPGCIAFDRTAARRVLHRMVRYLETEKVLGTKDKGTLTIPAKTLYQLADDAKVAGLLVQWLNEDEDVIIFA